MVARVNKQGRKIHTLYTNFTVYRVLWAPLALCFIFDSLKRKLHQFEKFSYSDKVTGFLNICTHLIQIPSVYVILKGIYVLTIDSL